MTKGAGSKKAALAMPYKLSTPPKSAGDASTATSSSPTCSPFNDAIKVTD
jgi:hypothetical protein